MASTATAAAAVPPPAQRSAQSPSPAQNASAAAASAGPVRPRPITNGIVSTAVPPTKPAPTQDSIAPSQSAHERLIFLVANFVGCNATVSLSSGECFTGVFSTPWLDSPEPRYALKMTKSLQRSNSSSESAYVGVGEDHLMHFEVKHVVDLQVSDVSLDKVQAKSVNGTIGFRTDTDISGNSSRAARELTRWEPGAACDVGGVSFSNTDRGWDQFEVNKRLYGVETDYNEELYTTKIDRSDPSYRRRLADAERLAREIESTSTTNIHQAEERGLTDHGNRDVDEEERYSGVRREVSPLASTQNRYTPPARRAPTGQPTVPGAPVDPAIISSQLAQPPSQSKSSSAANESTKPSTDVAKENMPPTNHNDIDGDKAKPSTLHELILDKPSPEKMTVEKLSAHATPKAPVTSNSKQPSVGGENATQTVARDVLKSFKDFSATEKLRMREARSAQLRKEKDVKLNDLKHWGLNFKLKNEVPSDMLGILAKDKTKQAEIVEKAKRQASEKQQAEAAKAAAAAATTATSANAKAPATSGSEPVTNIAPIATDKQSARNLNRNDKSSQLQLPTTIPSNRQPLPGNLAPRLKAQMQQQQQQQSHQQQPQPQQPQQQKILPTGPASFEPSASRGSSHSATSSNLAKFNPAAFEFRPNPAAASFAPSASSKPSVSAAPASPIKPKPAAARPGNFFGDKRPSGPRKGLRDGFNPIARMKREGEQEQDPNRKAAITANGGIPSAYTTVPRWPTSSENEDKKHWDCFAKPVNQAPMGPQTSVSTPYADQLPPNVHSISGQPQVGVPHQGSQHFPPYVQARAGEHGYEGPRMHPGAYSSPRVQPPMMMQPSPMMGHSQPYGQPIQQFAMGGQPMYMRTSSQQFQGQHMATSMVPNPSGGAPYMNVPHAGGMPMYPPQFQFVPAQGPGAYGSPRGAPMMVQQGSQQGQAPQFMIQGQPGQPMYSQHPPQMMRPGMQPQQQQQPSSNYGSPLMMNQHFPPQPHRGNSFSSNQSFNNNHYSQQQQASQRPPSGHQPAQVLANGPAAMHDNAK